MIVLVNPYAGGGRAAAVWERLYHQLQAGHPSMRALFLGGDLSVAECIGEALKQGERYFVAAGGDGTVNLLLNTLLNLNPDKRADLVLGAIALGSSNDFHKPIQPFRCTDGIPCKLDFPAARPRDVVQVSYSEKGNEVNRYFLINASAGLTAEANAFFNKPDRLLKWLKRGFTNPAILYAAIRTIFRYRNEEMTLTFPDDDGITVPVTNLGIVRNPHFSGGLRYGDEQEVQCGMMGVHLCYGTGIPGRLRLMAALARGTFDHLPRTMSRQSQWLRLDSPSSFSLELDGEIVATNHAVFTVLANHIRVCP
jgi:diacylglycerol kinase (ATP)